MNSGYIGLEFMALGDTVISHVPTNQRWLFDIILKFSFSYG